MTNEFLHQLSPEDKPVSDILQAKAQSIHINPQFQASLEARLKEAHPENKGPARGFRIRLLPAIGWVILALGAFLVLNWAVRSLAPGIQPATDGTPVPEVPFETEVQSGNICQGQLAVAHGFSVFLSDQDKSGLIELDDKKSIGELRSFAWSPDGNQVAIVGNTRGSGNLYVTDSAGTPLQPIFARPEFGYLAGVAWSQGGDRLLTWEISDNTKLFVVDLDGTGAAVVNLPVHASETPQFAPDDKSILFFGGDATSYGLFRVTIDGSSQVSRISGLVEDETSFAWSPDGSRLAYIEMDRDLGEARLVVETNGSKDTIATLPIPKGSGSSIPSSANLSWSPDGQGLVFEFGRNASDRTIYQATLDGAGLVPLVKAAHAAAISPDGKCLAYISNKRVYLLDLAPSPSTNSPQEPVLFADLPAGRGPADFQLDKLGWGTETAPGPDEQGRNDTLPTPTPIPSGMEYDWRGTRLYLSVPLPDTPVEANVYQLQPEQPATLESARALAQRFGLQGEVYLAPGELPDTTNFLVTDGKQRLYVRSEQYFTYYADFANYTIDMFSYQQQGKDTAPERIDRFLKEHGFDFAYRLEPHPQIAKSYYVVPLSPDGFPLRYNYMLPARMEIKLDRAGNVIFVQSGLVDYQQAGTFGLRTAEEAWQKVLRDGNEAGVQENFRSGGILEEYYWQRSYPDNQPVTIYGRLLYFPPAEASATPFTSIGDQTVTGNIAGMDSLEDATLVEATGAFSTENGIRKFKIDSWQVNPGMETSLMGTLKRDGDEVYILNYDGSRYPLADVPADAPFDITPEQGEVNVSGVLVNGQFEWSLIQLIPAGVMEASGGGGGGGSQGFYKLNLTGTPVPLPTMEIVPAQGIGEYTVQEGDTLSAIAQVYGIPVNELMQMNSLTEATIAIGQKLAVPAGPPESSPVGQKIEGQRGLLLVDIFRQDDGSQQKVYSLLSPQSSQYNFFVLSGAGLEGLDNYHNRPVDIWGTIESAGGDLGMLVHVDRFEVPFPDLQFQILRGTEEQGTVEDQVVTLFTTTDGQTYVKFSLDGNLEEFILGKPGQEVLYEALLVPGETLGGLPAVRVYSTGLAVNPQTGQPNDMQITADQPAITEGSVRSEFYAPPPPPTLTIEKVELVYYTADPRYQIPDPSTGPGYLQPVWRFYGHFSTGAEFEMLVQALKDEFLLPEVETIQGPG